MALKHPKSARGREKDLAVEPLFTAEGDRVPRHELPAGEMAPAVASRSSTTS